MSLDTSVINFFLHSEMKVFMDGWFQLGCKEMNVFTDGWYQDSTDDLSGLVGPLYDVASRSC
jgi:hypothetical protein